MSDWDNFKKIKSGGGDILKPEEGKSYKIRVIGEPWVYTSEYKGNVSTRFALKIYNQTDGAAQIIMLSKTAFGDIYDLKEDESWGEPSEYDISMKRTGQEKETKYSFVPQPKKPLEDDKIAEVESIVLDEVLSRLPSVQQAFPISQFDPEQIARTVINKKTAQQDEMPSDFLE